MCAVIICATSRKSAESSTHRAASPLEVQAVRDLVRARGKEMQAENLNAQVAAQVCMDLMRGLPVFRVDVAGLWWVDTGLD